MRFDEPRKTEIPSRIVRNENLLKLRRFQALLACRGKADKRLCVQSDGLYSFCREIGREIRRENAGKLWFEEAE